MSLTITDPATVAAMTASETPVTVYGPDGKMLGSFTPVIPGMSFPELGVTDEELERRRTDPNAVWVTGEEVMARLRSLRDAK